jgi:hypothetical protein
MDGRMMLYQLRQLLQESDSSSFLDDRTSYDYLYEAACELVSALKLGTASQTITTTATTSLYDLNADYLCLYVKNDFNDYVIKYYDGSGYYWPSFRDEAFIFQENSTSDSSIPNNFSIVDESTVPVNETGTATADGATTNGECTLTDAAGGFVVAGVSAGDQIHNTTDLSDGVVLSVTDATHLQVALFGGTANDWTSADAYTLIPQTRRQLFLDPPSLTAGHVITIKYVPKPSPVYSDFRTYRVPSHYLPAIVKYAAWLYKYRDREPNFGDAWYKYWEMQLRKYHANENRSPAKQKWTVNMTKRTLRDRSMR